MEPTPSQLSRKKDIKDFLNEKTEGIQSVYEGNDFLESQEQLRKMEHFGEAQNTKRIVFREDAAELGKKKTWKPNDFEKKKNKKIEESKKLTSRATADTLELYTIMRERMQVKAEKNAPKLFRPEPTWEEKKQRALALIEQLKSVRLEKRMLTTANVKMHFSEYMDIVDAYEELVKISDLEKALLYGERDEIFRRNKMDPKKMLSEIKEWEKKRPQLQDMINPISSPMEILKDRMKCYLARNRISLDGKILKEDKNPKAFVYSEWVDSAFKNTDSQIQKKMVDNTRYDPEQLLSAKEEILDKKVLHEGQEKSELEIVLKENDVQVGEINYPEDMKNFLEMTPVQRVQNIRLMRHYIEELRIAIADSEKDIKQPPEALEGAAQIGRWRDEVGEELSRMRREFITMKAILVLSEAEGRLLLAQNEDEQKVRLDEMEDAWADFSRVQQRFLKEKLPLTGTYGVTRGVKKITNKDAMNSASDRANYSFKNKIMDIAAVLKDGSFPELSEKAAAYASVTHYSTELREETRLLKELLAKRQEVDINLATDLERKAITELDSLLNRLQHGDSQNPIPDWNDIPESMRIDSIDVTKMPQGRTVAQLTEKELSKVDIIPKETSAGKQKGSYRNQALVSMRKWVTLDPDTPLFSHEPTINDLRQGKVSNCYMVASTTGLVNFDPQIIKDCIRDNGDGTVTVRLYMDTMTLGRERVPRFIRIPKRIPKLMTGGDILTDGPVWMQLIERAAAQAGMFREGRNGYQSLWYGRGDEWLKLLTGASGDVIVNQTQGSRAAVAETDDKVFELLERADTDRFIYHAGTKEDAAEGMNSGHAYTVLGVKRIGDERFVTLRNPYANMSRTVNENGEVTKSTDYFSSSPDDTYGQFDMPFEEFMRTMDTISYTDMNKAFPSEQIFDAETNKMREKTLTEIAAEDKNKVVRKSTTDPLTREQENNNPPAGNDDDDDIVIL